MAKITRPKITLSSQDKLAARANMEGEKLVSPAAPDDMQLTEPSEDTGNVSLQETQPVPVAEEIRASEAASPPREGTSSKRGRKQAKAPKIEEEEETDTHAVRLTRSIVVQARMNVLQLPKSMNIKNMREYGDAALQFYEAHLIKTGKLPTR